MKGLTIIKPISVTPAMLVSTDVPEADYPAYAAGTTYALADRVIDNHQIYQSLAAANLGNTPATTPAKWVLVSATNRWKLFDLVSSSQTTRSTSMSYTVRPGKVVTGIAATNLTGVSSVRVRMISDAYGLVFDKLIARGRTPIGTGWWQWYYGERAESISSYFADLPSFADAQIVVDFVGLADMAVGTLLVGTVSSWGIGVQTGMTIGIKDYSKKETNEWGDIILTQRSYADVQKLPLVLSREETLACKRYLTSLRGLPCLWITSMDAVYGYYQNFDILIAYNSLSECDLTIEGLT